MRLAVNMRYMRYMRMLIMLMMDDRCDMRLYDGRLYDGRHHERRHRYGMLHSRPLLRQHLRGGHCIPERHVGQVAESAPLSASVIIARVFRRSVRIDEREPPLPARRQLGRHMRGL